MGRRDGGGVGGGGKDTIQAPPVDQYRRRIGRQDSKKEKRHLKEVRQLHEAKENRFTAYKDSILILVAVSALFLTVYALLFFSLEK